MPQRIDCSIKFSSSLGPGGTGFLVVVVVSLFSCSRHYQGERDLGKILPGILPAVFPEQWEQALRLGELLTAPTPGLESCDNKLVLIYRRRPYSSAGRPRAHDPVA